MARTQVAVLRLALDVARGLQHLHKKHIIHGDLTPSNVLLRRDARAATAPGGAACGSGGSILDAAAALVAGQQLLVAKLADFGLSVRMKETETSVDNMRRGTPFYASEHQRRARCAGP
jgi:serine/threonine protein kinase